MTDVPSGWYDDPEQPDQYRYWDGTNWTDHRAPKAAPPPPASDAGGAVTEGWRLLWQNWLAILLIGVAFIAVIVVALVVIAVQASSALEPGVFTILERFSEPGFDPTNDPADEAFVDSIEFTPGPTFWVVTIVGGLVVVLAQLVSIGVAQIHLAAASVGRPFTLGESFRVALRRLPRWIGVYLLWGLVFTIAVTAVVLVAVGAGIAAPILLLLVIPAVIALFVYAYPFAWLATTALVIGPTDEPPFRTTVRLIREQGWRTVAWPVLLASLVVFGVNIGVSIVGAIPLLGQLIALAAQVFLYALPAALNIPIWRLIGGTLGADVDGG